MLLADYSKPNNASTGNNYLEQLSYDKNGNILTLIRNGDLDSDGMIPSMQIDNLAYTYDTQNPNRLMKVLDSTNSPQGFKDDSVDGINDPVNDYDYDGNGNMITDENKGITSITYNHLNLPVSISFGTNGTITYLYDASGRKVKKDVQDNITSVNTVVDYSSGGFQYENAQLQFFPHAEGYVNATKTKGGYIYNYVFNYTDHLGNIRLSYTYDEYIGQLKTLEENHYYPFGLKHTNYNSDYRRIVKTLDESGTRTKIPSGSFPTTEYTDYKYRYNSKEYQDELGLNVYDYQARNYDPALGRWMNIDPLAEVSRRWSPYSYCYNSPMFFVDPDGMFPFPISIRSFAPFKTFGGGFHGDGENRGFTTSATATSRVAQSFTTDPSAGTMSNVKTWSDPSSHPILGSDTEKPTGTISDFKQTTNKDGSNTVTFNSTMSGANPLVPGSPDIDVKTSFSLTENTKAGTLDVNISQTGDKFPAVETFIKDTSGNALFMGVSPYEGNPYTSLPGDNDRQMMSNSFTVTMDSNGVFTGVKQGDKTYTIAEWNKMYQGQPVSTEKRGFENDFGGGGVSGGGAGGGW